MTVKYEMLFIYTSHTPSSGDWTADTEVWLVQPTSAGAFGKPEPYKSIDAVLEDGWEPCGMANNNKPFLEWALAFRRPCEP
jgi:hypothetical protein